MGSGEVWNFEHTLQVLPQAVQHIRSGSRKRKRVLLLKQSTLFQGVHEIIIVSGCP